MIGAFYQEISSISLSALPPLPLRRFVADNLRLRDAPRRHRHCWCCFFPQTTHWGILKSRTANKPPTSPGLAAGWGDPLWKLEPALFLLEGRLRGPGPGPAVRGSGAKTSRLPRAGARARRRRKPGQLRLPRARARGRRLLVAPEPRTAGPGPREPGNFGPGASGSVFRGPPRPAERVSNLDGFAINLLVR